MEIYAMYVLALFFPHRCLGDIKSGTIKPFTQKLRDIKEADNICERNRLTPVLFTHENLKFLQNVQDTAYNSMRYTIKKDDLQSVTEPFTEFDGCDKNTYEDDEHELEPIDETIYQTFMKEMEKEADVNDSNPHLLGAKLQKINFAQIRMNGRDQCGYNNHLPAPEL
jgi:hypothetical protein